MNFQMFKLILEKAEEPEIKLPTSSRSSKKQESSRKTPVCFIDYAKAFNWVDHNKLWWILKEMGIPDHLTYLLRNLYAGQKTTVRTEHETVDWFKIGTGVCQGCIVSPAYLTYMQSTSCKMPGWMKHKLESRLQDQIRSVTQSCPTLCDPIDGSPPGSPVPGILQARTLEWVAISYKLNILICIYVKWTGWQ